jgi:hypothetical protein
MAYLQNYLMAFKQDPLEAIKNTSMITEKLQE